MRKSSLRHRILLGLSGYAVLLTVAVFIHGAVVNEGAEQLVWRTLLESELDHFQQRSRADPLYRWVDTKDVSLYDDSNPKRRPPPALNGLAPGVYDGIVIDEVERVVLIRDVGGKRLGLSLDITEIEEREKDMTLTIAGSAITMIVLITVGIILGVNHLLRPLSNLAQRIDELQPDRKGQHIEVTEAASAELVIIAEALNDYLQRNDGFVERERAFIDSASHELRTPIAVIAGATELVLGQPDLPVTARSQLTRIQRTARNVEHLISLLLVLAKDPARLMSISDQVALNELLPEIVEQHRHLLRDKDLTLTLEQLSPCEIVAPLPIVQAAIGNLVRNAIENSDRGDIAISLQADATVVVSDPGHGMTPEEISAIYARMARGGSRDGGGIGLDLIARLCEHLGWSLDLASDAIGGTTTTLRMQSEECARQLAVRQ